MRGYLISITLAFLLFINWQVWQKQRHLASGIRVLVALEPVDPRSLMQGDYMRLAYRLPVDLNLLANGRGVLELRLGVGAEVISAKPKAATQQGPLLKYQYIDGKISFAPDSYLFQEGLAECYEQAKFAQLVLDKAGNVVLSGLARADGSLLHCLSDKKE